MIIHIYLNDDGDEEKHYRSRGFGQMDETKKQSRWRKKQVC